MLSIYIHIPFCNQKCKYCSFNIFPVNNIENSHKIIDNYISSLEKEIDFYATYFGSEQIRSIYFGGGTPSKIGAKNIIRIIDKIKEKFNLENLAELSLEFNPYPKEEIYELIDILNKKYNGFSRLRYSFGIQSLDNKLLQESGRESSLLGLVDFIRGLRDLKQENNIFNFDFIAFGKFNETRKGNKQLRNENTLEFFQNFVNSGLAESFSLYTLELFHGSLRYHQDKNKDMFADDDIYEEFSLLKDIILDGGYLRYELSNFSKLGLSSIHNRVYREMQNYIGLGVSGSSFLNSDIENYQEIIKKINPDFDTQNKGIRFTNTQSISDYINGDFIDSKNIQILNEDDYLIEKFFLNLRTDQGIQNIDEFKNVLVKNYLELITGYQDSGFCTLDGQKIKLTDQGMDVFNSIVTDLLERI
ncbi:MAG: radical SAM protein [Candidatus Absconditicoccaceae bacterium]